MHATHSVATAAQAPVEKVADKLRMAFWSQQLQCQPSLLGVNNSGVWISSGKNEFHVAKGSLIGESITLVFTLFILYSFVYLFIIKTGFLCVALTFLELSL